MAAGVVTTVETGLVVAKVDASTLVFLGVDNVEIE